MLIYLYYIKKLIVPYSICLNCNNHIKKTKFLYYTCDFCKIRD